MKKTKFQPKTIALIENLRQILKTKKCYTTLSAFYREIELLKFPKLKSLPGAGAQVGNIYSQAQYTTIVNACVDLGWVSIVPISNRAYHVIVNQSRVKCIPFNS